MGDDSGLVQDSINYFDKPPADFDPNGEHDHVHDKGSDGIVDFRNRIARQWRCPTLALKALETMSVRNLIRVSQSAVERKPDAEESFVSSGEAFLSATDDGGMSEKKLVTIMFAFQRWRQSQLKNLLGEELVKVLEEAREDEIARAALETQLEHTEQLLATERAKSAMLHDQLATAVNSTKFLENGYIADNATFACDSNAELFDSKFRPRSNNLKGFIVENQVSKMDRQVMTMEDFKVAEAEIELRDNQIQQLKERIRNLEEKIGRVDGQLNRLHLQRSGLQAENSIVLRENRTLLEQLSSRDKEMVKQVEEMERLKALTTRVKEQQIAKQDRIDSMVAEHSAEVQILQEQLQLAYSANSCKEAELATSVEHCSHLKHEKGTLLMQLQEAEKRADLASTRTEELCAKLQSRSDEADESAEAASEMVKQLKKLAQNVSEREASIHVTDVQAKSSRADHGYSARKRSERTTSDRPCLADPVYNTFPQDRAFWENYPLCPLGRGPDQASVSLSSASDHTLSDLPHAARHSVPHFLFRDGITNWVTWKWRWAASSARAERLAKKLRNFTQRLFVDLHRDRKHQRVQDLMQKLGIESLVTHLEDELHRNSRVVTAEPKLVPLIMSAWRAFTRTSVLQRRALSRNASLGKMLGALPWWIRRARDRRQLERTFLQWLVVTLSAKRHPDFTRSNVMEEQAASYEDSRPLVRPHASFSTNSPQVKGPSEEMNAVNSQFRRAQRAPVAAYYTSPKPRLGDTNRNQLPRASQTRTLQAFQTALQQEVTELKKIAGQEIQSLQQRNSQLRNRAVTAPTESSYAKQRQPDGKKVLKSVLGVCNNLAMALTNVTGKLSPHVGPDALNSRRVLKISPRILADTVNTCIRNEQTKLITEAPARELHAEAPTSPRAAGNPQGGLTHQAARPAGNSIQAGTEGWGTQVAAATGQRDYSGCNRKPANINTCAHERRTRTTNSPTMAIPEPCNSRYQSPYRSHISTGTTTPNPAKKSSYSRVEMQNTASKDSKGNTTTYSQTASASQENGRIKRTNLPRDCKRPDTSNLVLNMSAIKKVLGDGASNASLEEKKLVGSALARLVSTKISKLRGGQAM